MNGFVWGSGLIGGRGGSRRAAVLAVIALSIGVLACGPAIARAATVGGYVRDEASGVGISQARATLYAFSASEQRWNAVNAAATNSSGYYLMNYLATGTYRIGFDVPGGGYAPEFYFESVTLADAASFSVGTAFCQKDAALTQAGRVRGTAAGSPNGATVEAMVPNGAGGWTVAGSCATTAGYTLDLPAGTYRLRYTDPSGARANGWFAGGPLSPFADEGYEIVVAAGSAQTKDLYLEEVGTVSGNVKDALGSNLPGIDVKISVWGLVGPSTYGYRLWNTVSTGADGSYTASGLPISKNPVVQFDTTTYNQSHETLLTEYYDDQLAPPVGFVYYYEPHYITLSAPKSIDAVLTHDRLTPDTLAPVTAIAGWTARWLKSSAQLALRAYDRAGSGQVLSGIKSSYYRIGDTGTWMPVSLNTSFPVAAEGLQRVWCYSVDNADNAETPVFIRTYVDSTAPSTTIPALQPVMYDRANLIFSAAEPGASGVRHDDPEYPDSGTWYKYDDGPWVRGWANNFYGYGDHTLQYYSIDAAGNREETKVAEFTIAYSDRVAPTTAIIGPHNDEWTNTDQYFRVDANDTAAEGQTVSGLVTGIGGSWYAVDDGDAVANDGAPHAIMTDGTHTITAWSRDAAGNEETSHSATAQIDKTPPAVSVSVNATYPDSASITIDATDGTSGIAHVYYVAIEADGWYWQREGRTANLTVIGPQDFECWAVDKAGNESEHLRRRFEIVSTAPIDMTPPVTTASFAPGLPVSGWTSGTVELSLPAVDAAPEGVTPSGLAKTEIREVVDGRAYGWRTPADPLSIKYHEAAGNTASSYYEVSYRSQDVLGNLEASRTVRFGIDKLDPEAEMVAAGTDHPNTWVIQARDRTVEGYYPSASGIASVLWRTRRWNDMLMAYGEFSEWQISLSQNTTVSVETKGTYGIEFTVADKAGNTYSRTDLGFSAIGPDVSAPVTTIYPSQDSLDYWSTTPVSLNAYCSDPQFVATRQSGLDRVFYSIGGGAVESSTADPTTVQVDREGTTTVSFWSVDMDRNSEATQTRTVKIDSVPPTVSCDTLSYYPSAPVTLTISAEETCSGIMSYGATLDESSLPMYNGNQFVIASWAGDGEHKIAYWAYDNANNRSEIVTATIWIGPLPRLDNTAPVIACAPKSTYPVSAEATFSATDEGGSNLAALTYRLDSESTRTATGSTGSVTTNAAGTHTLRIAAVDYDGNTTELSRTFEVIPPDVTPPTVSCNPASLYYGSAEITITASDNAGGSGVLRIEYRLDTETTATATGSTASVSTSVLGEHSLAIIAFDSAGNVSQLLTRTFNVSAIVAPPDSTALQLTASTAAPAYGAGIGLTATLRAGQGAPVRNAMVTFERLSGSTWIPVAEVATNPYGVAVCTTVPYLSARTVYRASFAGTNLYTASVSPNQVIVIPKASVTNPVAPTTASKGRSFTVYGYLKPGHRVGTYSVRIYKYRYVSGKWRAYGYVNAKATSSTKYAVSLKLPYTGKWRLSAYHADADHLATWSSGFDYVTVK